MEVLVVEDEPLIRMSICDLLEEAGFACAEAASPRARRWRCSMPGCGRGS